ncbi:MAG TPA: DUF3054 domain-containing protein [Intrasporangium sp.]|uniref:DUF3054 domain-containing protein n=1 Tax=Intrasporangium sp. TaxID=1925024 RepID=UPI002D7769D2|nr:DUF3054 domain-containing protein [Intrasporangium sp.]HET7398357.1 DUF3054 domain-containing protein [Intrasporangium sp.]
MTVALRWLRRPPVAFAVDAVLVTAFAAAGRASHAESSAVAGALGTAWPFLVGTIVGWALVRLRAKDWPLGVGPGITVWFATLVLGMLLRRVTGGGTAATFVVVAGVVLALLLVGWRAVVALPGSPARRVPFE